MAGARDIIRHRSQHGKIQSAETQVALDKDERARTKAEGKGKGKRRRPSDRRRELGERKTPPREYVKQHRRIPADKMLREQSENKEAVANGNTLATLKFASDDVAERAIDLGLTEEVLSRWNPADAKRGFTHGDLMFIKTEEDAEAARRATATPPSTEGAES